MLLEALEAIVHQLLFVRQLYPAELFERQQLYGVAVRRSRHPELNSYIAEVVGSLKASDLATAGARPPGWQASHRGNSKEQPAADSFLSHTCCAGPSCEWHTRQAGAGGPRRVTSAGGAPHRPAQGARSSWDSPT